MTEMTKEMLIASCKANGGYETPHLNDQLYLHCKGFIGIQNLEPYVNAKVLWLEHNAISELQGLDNQQELVSLFLQKNTIRSLRSLSTPLRSLRVLNISYNYITSLAGLDAACPQLETLQASHNYITSLEACESLWKLSGTLTSVDLSFNKISQYHAQPQSESTRDTLGPVDDLDDAGVHCAVDNDVRVVELNVHADATPDYAIAPKADPLVVANFFSHLPLVSVIYMHGNGITHGLKQYRRNMVLHHPALTYLDDRPVFKEERRVVEAWGRGGEEAETTERAAIRAEKMEHLNSCVHVLTERMEGSREIRDRLTRQWEQQRARELERWTQQRRQLRAACDALEVAEQFARNALEEEEKRARWDMTDSCAEAYAVLERDEEARRRAYEHAQAVQRITAEAQREIDAEEAEEARLAQSGAAENSLTTDEDLVSITATSVVLELAKSDQDILDEMEAQIQSVLHSMDTSAAATDAAAVPSAAPKFDRRTAKAERAVHTAVASVAGRLQADRQNRQQQREEVWGRFEQWERKMSGPL